MDIYTLSRSFWDFSFSNPEKMKPIHSSIYFFAIEHCNRLWWKEKFWFPTTMAMDAIWISNYSSYKKWLEELVEWGFIKMVQVSKNQYSANVISLIQFVWSTDKALDKALIKHGTKQHIKQDESIASIDIQVYNSTNVPITNIQDISKDIWKQALVVFWKEWVNEVIQIIKESVEEMGWVYKASTRERQYANHIAEKHKDWWQFLEKRKDWKWNIDSIREIIYFSLNPNNSFVKQIINAEDFWNKWADVIMAMRREHIEKQKQHIEKTRHNPTGNPLLNF